MDDRQAGMTLEDIGKKYGLTHPAVRKVLKKQKPECNRLHSEPATITSKNGKERPATYQNRKRKPAPAPPPVPVPLAEPVPDLGEAVPPAVATNTVGLADGITLCQT